MRVIGENDGIGERRARSYQAQKLVCIPRPGICRQFADFRARKLCAKGGQDSFRLAGLGGGPPRREDEDEGIGVIAHGARIEGEGTAKEAQAALDVAHRLFDEPPRDGPSPRNGFRALHQDRFQSPAACLDADGRQFSSSRGFFEGGGGDQGLARPGEQAKIATGEGSENGRPTDILSRTDVVADHEAPKTEGFPQPTLDDAGARGSGDTFAFERGHENPSDENGLRPRGDDAGKGPHLASFEALDGKRYESHSLIGITAGRAEPREASDAGRDPGPRQASGEGGAEEAGETGILSEAVERSGDILGVARQIQTGAQDEIDVAGG
jgi:hypothetical protein